MNPSLETARRSREIFPQMESFKNVGGINIEPMALYKKLDSKKVNAFLEVYSDQFRIQPQEFKKSVGELIEKINNNQIEKVNPHQLLAVLFLASRNRWKEVDLRKEKKSIEAVCEMLVGNHVNLTQGDGKTTAIIPIYSAARALLQRDESASLQPAVVVSASDTNKLGELQQEVRSFKTSFFNLIGPEQKKGKIEEKLVDCQVPDTHSDSILSENPVDIFKFASVNEIKILFLTHHQLIFETEKHPDQWGKFPPLVVDEVHLLDKTPYYKSMTVGKEASIQPTKKDISDYFFGRLLVEALNKEEKYLRKFFTFIRQQPELTEEGSQFISQLTKKITELITDKSETLRRGDNKPSGLDPLFEEVSQVVGTPLPKIINMIKESWDRLLRTDRSMRKEIDVKDLSSHEEFLTSSVIAYVSTLVNVRKGSEYSDVTDVRDSVRGIPLPSHQFSRETKFWLRVINKKIVPDQEEMISHYFQFASWLSAVAKGRLLGLSGSLYEQELSGKMTKSHIAGTLEQYSEGQVINLSPEQPPLPIPFINVNNSYEDLLESVVQKGKDIVFSSDPSPHFVICWNDDMAEELFYEFQINGLKARIINKDSGEKMISNTLRDLSDGEVEIVISSGQGSFGQNIKDSLDKFPDLKISVINPETEFQVIQAFTRKRAEKFVYDFNIFFDKKSLLLLGSNLTKKKHDRLLRLISEKEKIRNKHSAPELADLVSYVRGIDEEIKQLTIDALKTSQNKTNLDELFIISQDLVFINHIDPAIRKAKKQIYEQEIPNNKLLTERLQRLVEENFSGLGGMFLKNLAQELQSDLVVYLSNIELSLYDEYKIDFAQYGFDPLLKGQDREIYLKNLWDKKIEEKKTFWQSQLRDNHHLEGIINPYLQQRVENLEVVLKNISQFLDTAEGKKIDRSKIITYALIDLPFYPYDKAAQSKAFFTTNAPQRLPYGQLLVEDFSGPDLFAILVQGPNVFVNSPSLLAENNNISLQRFFLLGPEGQKKYFELIKALNPDIPFDNFDNEGTGQTQEKNRSFLLSSSPDDKKGIVIVVEN